MARIFGLARAGMRYLPNLHTPEEDIRFFSDVVLPSSRVTVAALGIEMVGFSAVKDGWLDHLYVLPMEQGQGIGGSLLERAQGENPKGLSLWVFLANVRAMAFYGRAGFVEVLRTDGRDNEEREPDAQMRWAGVGS